MENDESVENASASLDAHACDSRVSQSLINPRNFFATKGARNFGGREKSMRWKNAEGIPSQIKNLRAAYLI
jgi:hypothetical protein